MSYLSAINLSCIKKDRVLFEQLSFSVSPGQLLHIKGENGAGKTSLLRLLVGLAQPASGEILWKNTPINKDRQSFNKDLLYLGHKVGVSHSLTASENMSFWCQQQNVPTPKDGYGLLAKLGLVGLEEQLTGHLSAGQQRRVALTRLWLKEATLWVLDEPFTALDVKGIELLKQKLEEHIDNNGMVIMTSHQSLELGDKVQTLELEYQI